MAFDDITSQKEEPKDSVEERIQKEGKIIKGFIKFILDDMNKTGYNRLTKKDLEDLLGVVDGVINGTLTFDDLDFKV